MVVNSAKLVLAIAEQIEGRTEEMIEEMIAEMIVELIVEKTAETIDEMTAETIDEMTAGTIDAMIEEQKIDMVVVGREVMSVVVVSLSKYQ